MVDGDIRWNFRELLDHIDEAARALMASGIETGDRVGIWAPNIHEWVVAMGGVHRAGAIVIPLNTRFKGDEAAYVLRTAGARILFTVTDFLDTNYVALLRAATQQPPLDEIVVFRGPPAEGATSWSAFLARATSVEQGDLDNRVATITPDDVCNILFTSGTTGAPKGAMLRHGATVRGYDAWSSVVGLRKGDRYLIVNPFFHAFGLNSGILAAILKGATIVPHQVFDVPSVMRRVAEERISMLPGPPAIYQTMLDHPDLTKYDTSTLRLAVTGAAAVPVEMIRRMRTQMTFETIVTGYGLTEATGIATMCRHTDDPETISNTAGRPIPDVEMRIVAPDGTELGPGEPGEILIRGYNVMVGFYGNEDATNEAIDTDGWLHTGDIGVVDADGNLRITDRTKDMFIVGGFNAYPAEIENMIMEHPSVGQVAVVGVPDHRLGEVGVAFIVARGTGKVDPDAVIAWCREKMANYKVPRSVYVVDALPLNASNKVLKYELRRRVLESQESS
jgi:acyl-CoA synthetase (AMP-forming)/AMP-acid ligase II